MIRRSIALGMCLVAVGAAPALADDPTTAGYGETPVPPVVTTPETPVAPPVTPPVLTPSAVCAEGGSGTGAGDGAGCAAPKTTTTTPPQGGVKPSRVTGTTCADGGSAGAGNGSAGSGCAETAPVRDSSVAGARASGGSEPAATGSEDTAPVTPVAAKGDSLPFTGLDVGVIALMAIVLLLAGLGLRRVTNTPS